jgi:hypothetical protein
MPRRKQLPGPKPYFYVYVMAYASAEVKKRIESGEPAQTGDFKADLVHMSTSEYKAAQAFYRAVRKAMANPLAYEALIQAGQQMIADVTIRH